MKAKEFIKDKTVTEIETVGNTVLNLVINRTVYGLKTEMSNIQSGTKVTRTKNFRIKDGVLTSGSISLNLETTEILS